MTTDDPVLAAIARSNPEPSPAPEGDADRLLARIFAEAASDADGDSRRALSRIRARWLAPLASAAVVLAVIAIVVVTTGGRHVQGAADGLSTKIVFRVMPTPAVPSLSSAALQHELALLRFRVDSLGVSRTRVALTGPDQITVTLPPIPTAGLKLAERDLGTNPQLTIVDWEANVLGPSGQTAAAGLPHQSRAAIQLSQGGARGAGAATQSGAMRLYDAVRLASRQQPASTKPFLSRLGPEYFRFADAGTRSCPGQIPCELSGPTTQRPDGGAGTRVLAVPQGMIVVQAAGQAMRASAPEARFFVLRDHFAVIGSSASDVTTRPDANDGRDAVAFRLSSSERRAFQGLTAAVAHRGRRVSVGDTLLFQHTAIILDGQLLSVPQIDFREFLDGVISVGRGPVEIAGGLSPTDAAQLAAQLTHSIGSLDLKLVSPTPR